MKNASGVITGVIAAVILAIVASQLFPELAHALDNISATSGLPLASLFTPMGIVAILFSVAVFYGLYKIFWANK